LSAYDAAAVTASLELARYYESTLKVAGNAQAKVAANWIMGELSARLNREGLDIEAAPVNPEQLGGLIARIADQTISNAIAKKVFDALWQGQGKSADEIIEAQGLKQITDTGAIEALVDEVLAANPGNVAEFKAGKEKALNALVGQIMKAAKGKANPQQVNDLLKKKLS
ncbi:MAG: Asp-tRNA(Asn)/Glu-tRNA(Gln) amidotransferase GatCAB subunit B, partial [Fluviibacter sp.]